MRNFLLLLVVALAGAGCLTAQVNLPLGGLPSPSPKPVKPTAKTLTGTVTNKADQPLPGAVVYLKNMKTLTVKSYFAQKDGGYRFPQLALNTDYEVYAEKDGKKSPTKSVSQFDDRFTPTVNLKIDVSE